MLLPISHMGPALPTTKSRYPYMQTARADIESEAEIIKAHDRLVFSLARGFASVDVDDLVQIGRVALLEAARRFAQRPQNAQLWTFARRAVLGAMIEEVTREIGNPDIIREEADAVDEGSAAPDETTEVRELLSALDARDREVVERHAINGEHFFEIGEALQLSERRVRELYARGIKKLREAAA